MSYFVYGARHLKKKHKVVLGSRVSVGAGGWQGMGSKTTQDLSLRCTVEGSVISLLSVKSQLADLQDLTLQ